MEEITKGKLHNWWSLTDTLVLCDILAVTTTNISK
jgi:hypothetical protein